MVCRAHAHRTGERLNKSPHTLNDLKRFAKAAPDEAAEYLRKVATNLRRLGKSAESKAVRQLLTKKGGTLEGRLDESARALRAIFPATAGEWSKVHQKKQDTVGLIKGTRNPDLAVPFFVQGSLIKNADNTVSLQTESGRTLKLSMSNPRVTDTGLGINWVDGLIGDGVISLQGTPTEDRKGFNVEGFALNADGKFSEFTYGRVRNDGTGRINTPRGDVTVEDKTLLRKLKALPRLGVILPGAPKKRGNRLVYTQSPEEFFGLARWRETTPRGTGATREANVDMAFSIFENKPCEVPAEFASRINHNGRLWVRGDVRMSGNHATPGSRPRTPAGRPTPARCNSGRRPRTQTRCRPPFSTKSSSEARLRGKTGPARLAF